MKRVLAIATVLMIGAMTAAYAEEMTTAQDASVRRSA
jgi:hypothetical protein